MVLAAGKGTRMKSEYAKVLHPVAGTPMLEHVLTALKQVKIRPVAVVVGHRADDIKRSLTKAVQYVAQSPQRGTAHAVRCGLSFLRGKKGNVVVLAGDVPLVSATTLKRLLRQHQQAHAAATVLTMQLKDPTGYGRILKGPDQRVYGIREELDASPNQRLIREVNTGIYVFHVGLLVKFVQQVKAKNKKKEFYLTDVIEKLVAADHGVIACRMKDPREAYGINSRWDLAKVERYMQEKIQSYHAKQGVTITQPGATYIADKVKIGKDTVIHPFTFIEGDVQIGKKCFIGPFCRLRKGTRISDGATIGSFVEVVRSKIGKKTMIKHLSYVGDAQVGNQVNIGAGFITANYDGKKKHKTKIGDKAFVGVHTSVVAPASLGRNSKTGAGTVILKNRKVPDNALVVGAPAMLKSKSTKRARRKKEKK